MSRPANPYYAARRRAAPSRAQPEMTVLDLFSGIGGFSLGLSRAGIRTAAFCEIDRYCQGVLRQHWPHTPIYDRIETLMCNLGHG